MKTAWMAGLAATAMAAAGAGLPLEFDRGADWRPRPSYLADPTTNFEVAVGGGAATLTVREPGRGMKLEHPVRPFDPGRHSYLVFRYRAEALGAGYALWGNGEAHEGGQFASTRDLQADGRWHELAVDLAEAGVTGRIVALLTEVRARQQPASIAFDWIRLAEEVPENASVLPARTGGAPRDARFSLAAADLSAPEARPGWLAAPDPGASAIRSGAALRLSARGADRGMKWQVRLAAPVDLAPYRFAAVRYRAHGIAPWHDYFLWLAGADPDGRRQECRAVSLAELDDDGDWHVAVVPLRERFAAADLALQVSSQRDRGEIEIDRIVFSARRPLFAPEELLPAAPGWEDSALAAGSFDALEMPGATTSSAAALPGQYDLARWFPPGPVTVRGIPFRIGSNASPVIATSDDEAYEPEIGVGVRANELFLLLAMSSAEAAYVGLHGVAPLPRFGNPERFVVRVRYEDGVTDDHIPVHLGSGTPEVRKGIGVYGLPRLRPVPVRSVALRCRDGGARFALAGLTAYRGQAKVSVPAPLTLPAERAGTEVSASVPAAGGRVVATNGTVLLESAALRAELDVGTGISLRSLAQLRPAGTGLQVLPGPIFELSAAGRTAASDRVRSGPASVVLSGGVQRVRIPFDAEPAGVPLKGALWCGVQTNGAIGLSLDVSVSGDRPVTPGVRFPTFRGLRVGAADDTWYLWACKGGIVHTARVELAHYYGGEYPLQVADVFNPAAGGGLALQTRDLSCLFKKWRLSKGADGVDWSLDYWPSGASPGDSVPTAPVELAAHAGGWREALGLYRDWVRTWYRPTVPRKDWFRQCFNYRQHYAWLDLRDRATGRWRVEDVIRADRECFGRVDYLHIFDFGESRVFGRVGDYDHYDELGGREAMAAAVARAKELGVPVGVYIEGYLCDERSAWGRENVLANSIRRADGASLLYPESDSEHMMCAASEAWRARLAGLYRRVAGELRPDGMYIDQYGFANEWKVCRSAAHGHPVPWPPLPGERATTAAIRAAVPPAVATLTEETPCDFVSQFQDGALGYSVATAREDLAPHRVDLFRFAFPDFKVFQLVTYNPLQDGNWELLKFPFFNGEGTWLAQSVPDGVCGEARDFLRAAFAILWEHRDAFSSDDVEPLVPTLAPAVYANRFRSPRATVWTLYHSGSATFRGEVLRVPHRTGVVYRDAFSGAQLAPRIEGGEAVLSVVLGPRGVGCVVASAGAER